MKNFKKTFYHFFNPEYYKAIDVILYILFLTPGISIGLYFNYIIISHLGWFKFTGWMLIIILCCGSCAYLDFNLKKKNEE